MKPSGKLFDRFWRLICQVVKCERADVDWMVSSHYIGKWPGVCVLILGLKKQGSFLGTIVFALPPRETDKRYGGKTWELARLWVDDQVPTNGETWFMAQAVKYIKRHHRDVCALVSYADPSAGHEGVIYRAGNWISDGRTDDERKTPRFDYADAVTGKKYSRRGHVPEGVTLTRVPRVSKPRFVYFLNPKKQKIAA